MRKYISLCFLWMLCATLWGQSNKGYGGNFDPVNPDNPVSGTIVRSYELKVIAGNGGWVDHSGGNYAAGSNVYLYASPNNGYKFKYWVQGDSILSGSEWYYYTMPAKKSEVKAVFQFDPTLPDNPNYIALSYKVSVSSQNQRGGSVYCSSEKVKEGSYTYVSASPYSGYKFTGWYLDSKLVSKDSYYSFEMEGRNMHFTAHFEFDPTVPDNPNNNPNGAPVYSVEYKIDGIVCHTSRIPAGGAITAIELPQKEGHTFSGWSEIPTIMPEGNVVVSGTFKVNYYKVVYVVDNNTVATASIAYGTAINLIDVPTKEGYTFSGWKDVPATMPAKDITINGTYLINSYKLIYTVDGVVHDSTTVVYGSAISPINEPVKKGHTFSGWSEIPATMPSKDVTISGSFAVNFYNVTYKIDGENVYKDSVAYNSVITPPNKFIKEGYTLTWSNLPERMPDSDIIVDGNYAVNSYKVTYMVDGAEYKTATINYGSAVTLISAPTKEGYTFSGWSEAPATMPAKDITISGTFAVNSYKVIYMVDGAEYKTVTANYGSAVTLIPAPSKEGYTFSGWSEAPATMPAKDITINGSFAVNSYKVTYMVDGAEYQSATVAYGSAVTLIPAPSKEGYTFSGWSEAPATMPAKDITINGSFAVNSYKVTYMVDGAEYQSATVAYGSAVTLIPAPSKEGYTFSGWSEAPATMPAKDITINGSFAVNSYKVTYMVDGAEYQSATVAYGSAVTLIPAPTKEGYTFSGWSEAPATMPAKDITINGTFAVNSYKVTYMVDGTEYQSATVAYGSAITLISAPTKEGYTFSGWSEAPATMPAKDITISGTFAVNSYKVTYMVDGTEYQSATVAYGSAITLISAPTKEGYTFSGWSEAPATMPAKDITISGTFAVNSYKVTYMVDGAEYKTVTVNYGDSIRTIESPVKEGFAFSGWIDAPDIMPAKDIVINGKFLVNAYSVTYVVDGVEYRKLLLSYGSAVTLIDTPTKEGYTFSGWSEAPATMPAKDITISGTFAVNYYKVTYMVDGTEYQSATVAYGSAITLISAPTKEGYTFSGWSEAPATMPAKDITINGTFAVNSYKVTYMVDGAEYKSATVAYGSAITLISAPSKEGYTFSGWSEAPATMPAKDITINGTFAVNSYKVTYMVDGAEYKSATVAYGSAITLISAPTKEGYTFSGWSEAPATMPAKDITINGTFAVNSYKVTYMVDGAEYKSATVAYGSAITLISAPTKEGYTFSGWSEAPATMPAKDITINGTFAVNSYKVTYMVDGAEYKTVTVNYGDSIRTIEAPVKEGFAFSGWIDAPDIMPAKDIVINGKFLVNAYSVTYVVDGVEYRKLLLSYGSAVTFIDTPTKEGYTFSGWSEAPATMPAKDITISGTFAVNYYKVTYMVDEEAFATDSIAYGSAINLIDTPTKEGYTFSGWSEAPATMPAKDITISGTFAVNYYKVTYMVDEKAFATDSIAYGSAINLIDTPTKEGYTFSGWSEAPATMPAKDITISGTFAVNYYKVTYMVDEEAFATDSIAYSSAINLIDIPTKEGYTFSGWSEAPATMPAKDITISGTFAVNYYKVTYMVDEEAFATDSIAYGSAINLIDIPIKEGYTFSGWSEAPATMPAKDITISGTFAVNYYKVTYMVDEEAFATDSIAYGSAINLIDIPTKEGYTFSGWSEAPATMPAKDITISGTFAVNYYKVTYMVDEEAFATDSIAYGSAINLIDIPIKEGYTFSGWSEAPATMPAKDITISGTFAVNYYTLTYIIDGEEYIVEQIAYGDSIVLVDAPVKEGYTFSGWSAAPITMPAEDVTITGSFVSTGISTVAVNAIVMVNGYCVIVSGANDSTVAIYTTSGALVERIDSYNGEEIILEKGVYIVCVGNKSIKVKL